MSVSKKKRMCDELIKGKLGRLNTAIVFVISVVILAAVLFAGWPKFTGFVTQQQEVLDTLNLVVAASGNYTWRPTLYGSLTSLSIDGSITSQGRARVYLVHNDSRYLVFDSNQEGENQSANTTLSQTVSSTVSSSEEFSNTITGFSIIEEPEIQNETLNSSPQQPNVSQESSPLRLSLMYYNNSVYDQNNDGRESVYSVVDVSVGETHVDAAIDKNTLCTRWEVFNIDDGAVTRVCYGNETCCSYLGVLPKRMQWDEPYYAAYGTDGAGYTNIISAQVISIAESADTQSGPTVLESEWQNLSVIFFDAYQDLRSACVDTCNLEGFNASSYTLLFEIENTTLRVDALRYMMAQEIINEPPVLVKNISNLTLSHDVLLNLSDYFIDTNGDRITYAAVPMEGITITFSGSLAEFHIERPFNGTRFTAIVANDSFVSVTSNIFAITVIDNGTFEIFQNITWPLAFIIKNHDNFTIAKIDEQGDMKIGGMAYTNYVPLIPPPLSFIIANSSEESVAFITSKGDMYLQSGILQNTTPVSVEHSLQIHNVQDELVALFDDRGMLTLKGVLHENSTS